MNKVLADIINCPKCGSDDVYSFNTDEFELEECTNNGHAVLNYYCKDCKHTYRVYVNFKYELKEV